MKRMTAWGIIDDLDIEIMAIAMRLTTKQLAELTRAMVQETR